MKFRGAGQGPNALIAEIIVGEIARAAGLTVPEIVLMELPVDLARTEPDPEIQDLIRASGGINVALDYLPGSTMFDPVVDRPDPAVAASIVWLDALTLNVDRTPRNPNLLMWHRRLWLIDHGAALYFHHGWSRPGADPQRFARQPYDASEHVLVGHVAGVAEAGRALAPLVSAELLAQVLDQVPDEWLEPDGGQPDEVRRRYADYLLARLAGESHWLPRAVAA
jgi:hypothetical protein